MEKPNVTGEGMDESKGCVCVLVMRVEALRACYITPERQKKTQQPDIVVGVHSREALLGSREMRLDACVPMNGRREQGVRGRPGYNIDGRRQQYREECAQSVSVLR